MPNEDIWAMRDNPLEKAERAQSSDLGQKTRGRKKNRSKFRNKPHFLPEPEDSDSGKQHRPRLQTCQQKKREEVETKWKQTVESESHRRRSFFPHPPLFSAAEGKETKGRDFFFISNFWRFSRSQPEIMSVKPRGRVRTERWSGPFPVDGRHVSAKAVGIRFTWITRTWSWWLLSGSTSD